MSVPEATSIRVYMLGQFRVEIEGLETREPLAGRAVELLAYLLLFKARQHRREALAEQLWGDQRLAGRKSLRQALWRLHSTLGVEAADALVESMNGWLRVRRGHRQWIDLDQLEEGYSRVEDVCGQELSAADAARVESATDLYQGELLEGLTPSWCELPRERARHMYKAMLLKLMSHCLATGQYQRGVRYGLRLLQEDPASELGHRRLMRLYRGCGDRAAALRQYASCLRALRDELGVSPEAKTLELFLSLRRDQLGIPQPSSTSTAGSAERLGGMLHQLTDLHVTLCDVRHRVWEEIQKAERVLSAIN